MPVSVGDALEHALALVALGGQVLGRDLERQRGPVVDEHVAVAVEDLAARRLDLDLADLVVLGLGQIAVARQHLQVPEPQEDDREHRQRDPAEHRDAERRTATSRASGCGRVGTSSVIGSDHYAVRNGIERAAPAAAQLSSTSAARRIAADERVEREREQEAEQRP